MENGINGKVISAVSMESLDNCSTISSIDQPSQVRTLFVSGLPIDTRPRELYLLFRSCPGYETSQLKTTNKNGKNSAPIGFVTFRSRSDADEARRLLHGICFDPENPQTLRLELAKQTTKVTKPKQISPPIISPNLINNGVGMRPPPMINTNNFISNIANQNTANAAAAAAAYAVAAQQAATLAAVGNAQDHNSASAASLMAMNGNALSSYDQFSFLAALSESQQQQALAAIPQLVPFAAANPATFQMFTPIGTPSSIQQFSGQQAAIAAAMAQLQHQQQAQSQQQQQNAIAAIASSNPFLALPPPPPPTSQSVNHNLQQQQQAAALMAAAVAAASNLAHGNQQQPCSTLFVANLGSNPVEEELKQLFKTFSGFSRLRMHSKGGSPVAFVEYHDVRQAVAALNGLQGYQVSSSERGNGIRIEFARTKMGDVNHSNGTVNVNSNNNSNVSSLKVNS